MRATLSINCGVEPSPRRVHKDHVCAFTSRSGFADPSGGIRGKEAGVLHAVVLCIANGVVHGVAVHLHAHYLLCMIGGGQADGSDAAVGIQHHFFLPVRCAASTARPYSTSVWA